MGQKLKRRNQKACPWSDSLPVIGTSAAASLASCWEGALREMLKTTAPCRQACVLPYSTMSGPCVTSAMGTSAMALIRRRAWAKSWRSRAGQAYPWPDSWPVIRTSAAASLASCWGRSTARNVEDYRALLPSLCTSLKHRIWAMCKISARYVGDVGDGPHLVSLWVQVHYRSKAANAKAATH